MPTGPKGQKRPADSIGCAVMIGMIATGDIADTIKEPSGRTKSGKAGGKARSNSLTKEQRSAIAKKAAEERWK